MMTEENTQEELNKDSEEEKVEEETNPQAKTFSYDGWIPLNKLYGK